MKDWKIKQEIYHRLNTEYDDDLNSIDYIITDTVKEDALRHFEGYVADWIYPAKSYVVAFCYAYWLSVDYDEDMLELLNDPSLLADNDPFFKVYSESPEVYDYLFDKVELPIPMNGMVPHIKEYYNAECGR